MFIDVTKEKAKIRIFSRIHCYNNILQNQRSKLIIHVLHYLHRSSRCEIHRRKIAAYGCSRLTCKINIATRYRIQYARLFEVLRNRFRNWIGSVNALLVGRLVRNVSFPALGEHSLNSRNALRITSDNCTVDINFLMIYIIT